jgi:hypothetical protein
MMLQSIKDSASDCSFLKGFYYLNNNCPQDKKSIYSSIDNVTRIQVLQRKVEGSHRTHTDYLAGLLNFKTSKYESWQKNNGFSSPGQG